MRVAQLRGCQFSKYENGVWNTPTPQDSLIFSQAMDDVGMALDYRDQIEYNNRCQTSPEEVQEHIRKLA